MNLPLTRMYRLAPRGGGGLACDEAGVALGPADLVRVGADGAGRRHYEVRPRQGLGLILSAAYEPQREDVLLRLHRGLCRAASAIEAGDLCLAGIETVLLGLPDPAPSALAKIAEVAELEKGGAAWENQPRVPAGQSDGGQWTTEGGVSRAPAIEAEPAARVSTRQFTPDHSSALPLDDGVYLPDVDAARLVHTAGAEEEEAESRLSNGPPDDPKTPADVFPGFKAALHAAHALLAPIDGFLGASAAAGEADLEAVSGQYWALIKEIKQVDPSFADQELLPADGIAGRLSRDARI